MRETINKTKIKLDDLLWPGQTMKDAQIKALSGILSECKIDYYTPGLGWGGDILAGLLTELKEDK